MNLAKDKISRPNKTFIEQKDCLDKELKDKTPMRPQLPKKKPLLGEYEKRNHVEVISNTQAPTSIRIELNPDGSIKKIEKK